MSFHFSVWAASLGLALIHVADVADEPIVIDGGLSPDGSLSIVIARNHVWGLPPEEARDYDYGTRSPGLDDGKVYLRYVKNRHVIGPLEEIDSIGGGFGTSLTNLEAQWSPDSHFLAISYRSGRLNHSTVIYRIVDSVQIKGPWRKVQTVFGDRAIPQILPNILAGPNAKVIFRGLTYGPNSGNYVDRWLSPNEVEIVQYGLRYDQIDGLASGRIYGGEPDIIFSYSDKGWQIKEFKMPFQLGSRERPFQLKASSSDGRISTVFEYPGATDKYSALILRNYRGKVLFQDDRIFAESAECAAWSNDNKFAVVTTNYRGRFSAWLFSMKDLKLKKLDETVAGIGSIANPMLISNGRNGMTFRTSCFPDHRYHPDDRGKPVTLRLESLWRELR